ncbi:MAG: 50S ribosomal protein L29 [Candidatus Gastranaerophilales bacterium]|nr:50S ribosomal protein L29 [Candidatus Gastranaerophilales bacterium]
MKLAEIRERTIEELQEEIVSLRKKLFDLRLAKSMHKLEDTADIAKTKKEIAKIKTVIKEKEVK